MKTKLAMLNNMLKEQILQVASGQGRRETAVPELAISRYNIQPLHKVACVSQWRPISFRDESIP